jgi:two-component system, OmpR family, KDP operon response regulator KdpE
VTRILVVEDDVALRSAIDSTLRRQGYEVDVAEDGAGANTALAGARYDAVLLDVGLPFVSGWTILSRAALGRLPPVIVISARGEEGDKVRALDMGADDYLAKPFGADELGARIRAVVRRSQPAAAPVRTLELGRVTVDLANRTVWRDEVEVGLSPTMPA